MSASTAASNAANISSLTPPHSTASASRSVNCASGMVGVLLPRGIGRSALAQYPHTTMVTFLSCTRFTGCRWGRGTGVSSPAECQKSRRHPPSWVVSPDEHRRPGPKDSRPKWDLHFGQISRSRRRCMAHQALSRSRSRNSGRAPSHRLGIRRGWWGYVGLAWVTAASRRRHHSLPPLPGTYLAAVAGSDRQPAARGRQTRCRSCFLDRAGHTSRAVGRGNVVPGRASGRQRQVCARSSTGPHAERPTGRRCGRCPPCPNGTGLASNQGPSNTKKGRGRRCVPSPFRLHG